MAQNDPAQSIDVHDNDIEITGLHVFGFPSGPARVGISIKEMATPHFTTAFVRDNTIEIGNALHGISMEDCRRYTVEHNIIDKEFLTVVVSGIGLFNSTRNIIRQNTITGAGITSPPIFDNWGNSGIYVQSSPENFLLCNELENLHNGVMIRNMAITSTIGRNEFIGPFKYGLHYGPLGDSGPQYNTLNTWPGATVDTDGFEALHEGGYFQILNSKYYVANNVSDGMPDPVFPEEDWFTPSNNWPGINACSEYEHLDSFTEPGETERLTAIDSLESVSGASAYIWNHQRQLYDYLNGWPLSTWETTVYEDFLDNHATSDVGEWHEIEMAIRQSLNMNSSEIAHQSAHVDTILFALKQIALNQIIIDTTQCSTILQDAIRNIEDILEWVEVWMDDYRAEMHTTDSTRISMWESILDDLSSATVSEDWHVALHDVYTGYLEYLITDTLSGWYLAALEDIASECFETHGRAVYMAGSLHSTFVDNVFLYKCAASIRYLKDGDVKNENKFHFDITPNPAIDWITIDMSEPMEDGNLWI